MSLNSFSTVRLSMCSQSLLELKLFGETWRGSCESQQPAAALCHRLLSLTAAQR